MGSLNNFSTNCFLLLPWDVSAELVIKYSIQLVSNAWMGGDEGAKILGTENLKRFFMGKVAFLKCTVICFFNL